MDHAVAWSMLGGIFFTTHVLQLGVNTALIVNIFTNWVPLYWFLWKRPIPHFFSKGFEFSLVEIKTYWKIAETLGSTTRTKSFGNYWCWTDNYS